MHKNQTSTQGSEDDVRSIIAKLKERGERYKLMSAEEVEVIRDIIGFPKPFYCPPDNTLGKEGVQQSAYKFPPKEHNLQRCLKEPVQQEPKYHPVNEKQQEHVRYR